MFHSRQFESFFFCLSDIRENDDPRIHKATDNHIFSMGRFQCKKVKVLGQQITQNIVFNTIYLKLARGIHVTEHWWVFFAKSNFWRLFFATKNIIYINLIRFIIKALIFFIENY